MAAPHSPVRNDRRLTPVRRALSSMRRAASAWAAASVRPTGIGAYSPLEVESSLIGSVGSLTMATSS